MAGEQDLHEIHTEHFAELTRNPGQSDEAAPPDPEINPFVEGDTLGLRLPRAMPAEMVSSQPPLQVTKVDEKPKTITVAPLGEGLPFKVLHDPAFIHFAAGCREINGPKVASQLARLVQAGAVPDKNLWKTDQRHQIVGRAVARCKDPNVIRGQWPFLCFLRGASIGNRALEVQLFIAWVLLGLVTELYFDSICTETTTQKE